MIKKIKEKIKGFTLLYTVIIVSIIAVVTGIIAGSILKEIRVSRDEGESLKAFYAADSGIECVKFYQDNYQALDPRSPSQTYTCSSGDTFTAGGQNINGDECIDESNPGNPINYNFTLHNFTNGACTEIDITITPETIYVAGEPYYVCRYYMESAGKNDCSAPGSKLVERTRWETM
jgi:type II secretory pathway pseudopilin PulG